MSTKKNTKPAEEAPPVPANRAVKSGTVRVRARQTVCEFIDGVRTIIEAGQEGEVAEARLAALGTLVEVVTPQA